MKAPAPIYSYAQEEEELTEYELARLAAIKANTALLLSLGLEAPPPPPPSAAKKKAREPSLEVQAQQNRDDPLQGHLGASPAHSLQRSGRGVRPGRAWREQDGRTSFESVLIGDDAESSWQMVPASPEISRRASSRTVAASESPKPSSYERVSPIRRLRGRAGSAPQVLSEAQYAEEGLRRSQRKSRRAVLGAGGEEAGCASSERHRSTAYPALDSFIVPDDEALQADAEEGAFIFNNEVLPRLQSSDASADRPRRKRQRHSSIASSASTSSSQPSLLSLGPSLRTRRHSPKHFGPQPGIPLGSWFPSRMACSLASLHAPTVAGISGNARQGAWSLCLSGGYEDDEDLGSTVTFTGSGGRDLTGNSAQRKNLRTAPQSCDQSFESPLNAALKTSMKTGRPVRVLRGFKGRRPYAPPAGYLYSGLYTVQRCWLQRGQSGFMVCRFALQRIEGQGDLPTFKSEEEE